MSVPKLKRKQSSMEFIANAQALRRHLNYYANGEKWIKGNPQNKRNKVDRIYQMDLAYIKQLGNNVYKNVMTAEQFNPTIEQEYYERVKHLKYALANLYLIDEEESRLIDKYVKFDSETDDVISLVANSKRLIVKPNKDSYYRMFRKIKIFMKWKMPLENIETSFQSWRSHFMKDNAKILVNKANIKYNNFKENYYDYN